GRGAVAGGGERARAVRGLRGDDGGRGAGRASEGAKGRDAGAGDVARVPLLADGRDAGGVPGAGVAGGAEGPGEAFRVERDGGVDHGGAGQGPRVLGVAAPAVRSVRGGPGEAGEGDGGVGPAGVGTGRGADAPGP